MTRTGEGSTLGLRRVDGADEALTETSQPEKGAARPDTTGTQYTPVLLQLSFHFSALSAQSFL